MIDDISVSYNNYKVLFSDLNIGKLLIGCIWHFDQFLSHKINFVTPCFRPFYQKKKIFFFEKPRNFQFFMCFGPRRSFYEKSSGVRRPADKTLMWKNFDFK